MFTSGMLISIKSETFCTPPGVNAAYALTGRKATRTTMINTRIDVSHCSSLPQDEHFKSVFEFDTASAGFVRKLGELFE